MLWGVATMDTPMEALQVAALHLSTALQSVRQGFRFLQRDTDVDRNVMTYDVPWVGERKTNWNDGESQLEDVEQRQNQEQLLQALGQIVHLKSVRKTHHQTKGGLHSRTKLPAHSDILKEVKGSVRRTWSRVQDQSYRGSHAPFASISGSLGIGTADTGVARTPKEAGLRDNLDEGGAIQKPEWTSEQEKRGKEGRFLIHEVQILDSEGNDLELDHPELKSLIQKTMKISNRPGFAFNVKEVHDDIDRLGRLGLFENVVPYTKDTRDGVVLQLHVRAAPLRG